MCLNKATCGKVSKMNPTHKIKTTQQTKQGEMEGGFLKSI